MLRQISQLSIALVLFLCLSLALFAGNGDSVVLTFDMNTCNALSDGPNQDYSEFQIDSRDNGAVNLSSTGLYRLNPIRNSHSCTMGPNGDPAVCVAFDPFCDYFPGNSAALRFNVTLDPILSEPMQLEMLSFYQQAPEMYSWIGGSSGLNNYPTKYAVRILRDGVVIYDERSLATSLNWQQDLFDFEDDPNFIVEETTTFEFELTAYCPISINAHHSIWDIDNIAITANCLDGCEPFTDGGEVQLIDGSQVYYGCYGSDMQIEIQNSLTTTSSYYYLLTDENFEVLSYHDSEHIDLTELDPGKYFVYGYLDLGTADPSEFMGKTLSELSTGACSLLSASAITLFINEPMGGVLTGGPFEFCTGDDSSDFIPGGTVNLIGNVGANSQWIITDASGDLILGLPQNLSEFDFDLLPSGTCLLYHLTFDGWVKGLDIGGRISALTGATNVTGTVSAPACYDLSNPVEIVKNQLTSSQISGGPFTICVGDGEDDFLADDDVALVNGSGTFGTWVVTDVQGQLIISTADRLSDINFESSPRGNCVLWHLSYDEAVSGLAVGNDFTAIGGCLVRSNFITITKYENQGGTITGGPFEFCVGDAEADIIPEGNIMLTGNVGANSQWVATDMSGVMTRIPLNSYSEIDFNNSGLEQCKLYHMSYDGPLGNFFVGNPLSSVTGCYMLSNELLIDKKSCKVVTGGTLSGGPYNICAGDGSADFLTDLILIGSNGIFDQWAITDANNVIIELPSDISTYDFESAIGMQFLVRNVSYEQGLMGLSVGNNLLNDLSGNFALSNAVNVIKSQPIAGTLSGAPLEFCVGDGTEDRISNADVTLLGQSSSGEHWVITDAAGDMIMHQSAILNTMNVEEDSGGTSLLFYIATEGPVQGLVEGASLDGLTGCFDLSNGIPIIKNEVDGGILNSTEDFYQFCVGDGIPDIIPAGSFSVTNNIGDTHQWVVTTPSGNEIIDLPASPYDIDFDTGVTGNLIIWSISSIGPVTGLTLGADFSLIGGCVDRSNFVTVFRYENSSATLSGGPFMFCVGDDVSDFLPAGAIMATGQAGANQQWLVVDESGMITNAPLNGYEEVDFDNYVEGTCMVYLLSYDGSLVGLGSGQPLSGLEGCFSLSNGIPVTKELCGLLQSGLQVTEVSAMNGIKLTNTGEESLDPADFWLCDYPEFNRVDELFGHCDDRMSLEPGESITIKPDFSINPAQGELALMMAHPTEEKVIAQYVKWGSSLQGLEEAAIEIGLWTEGDFIEGYNEETGLSYDGEGNLSTDWTMIDVVDCKASTSTEEEGLMDIKIFPNPVAEILTIKSDRIINESQLRITDTAGKEMPVTLSQQNQELLINMGDLPSGMYLIRILSEAGWQLEKVFKN